MNEDSTAESISVTPELLRRYDRPGPRYTSYPTAPVWREDFGDAEYRQALAEAASRPGEPLSVYIHIPFCQERCAFCGCNVIISKKEGVADIYLQHVQKELEMASRALGERRTVRQLHWGGGTPTFLHLDQIQDLFEAIRSRFTIAPDAEIALEMDPRVTTHEQVQLLRSLGFNRVSMGVQDLDPEVQCEIHRFQNEEQTRRLFGWCRDAGFSGINMDLIYGLPGQKPERWSETLDKVIDIGPDRLAVYSYAYLPDKLHNQRHIETGKLPSADMKATLLTNARARFTQAGYRAIGMDHFAKPHDELALAMDQRRLRRNFMGYTVVPATDMLGIGTSAIGEIGGCYAQNEKKLSRYYEALSQDRFATACGCVLTIDDRIRSWVIREIMCNFFLDHSELVSRFGVSYDEYFAEEEKTLAALYDDGFVVREDNALRVLPLGQIFVRNIAMVFDAYLKKSQAKQQFSRTV
ncbi:MAG: oxygen-independent coproporphyrinogen III oxidase [Candidatus Hydrogenedentes bacterium]|nr:oxygen-independent coproporphyrinogen III oxidase [Candidatus Hydrogenedentota bacterium]